MNTLRKFGNGIVKFYKWIAKVNFWIMVATGFGVGTYFLNMSVIERQKQFFQDLFKGF